MPIKQDIVTAWDERTQDISQSEDRWHISDQSEAVASPRLSPDVSSHPLDLSLTGFGHILRPPVPEPLVLRREEPQSVAHLPWLPHVDFQTTHGDN